jgi:pSer/pThr/pTyr-binding forkhead associated (FHA) protein
MLNQYVGQEIMEQKDTSIFFVRMDDERKWEPIRIQAPVVLGRADTADVKIEHESISGQHAKITYENAEWMLSDLGSTNGTRINGERIEYHAVNEGDLVSIGLINFLVKTTRPLPRLFCPAEGRTFALGMLPFIVGRTAGNHLMLSDTSISGRHATFSEQHKTYFVKDNNSTNGVRVNGRRIQYSPLQDGDNIKIGRWEALFLIEDKIKADKYCLTFLGGERAGEVLEVSERFKIGRTADNDLVISQTPVTQNHALIYWNNGRFWLKDLGSTNGTRVGGMRIQEVAIKHGDEISIATESLLFHSAELPKEKFYLVFLGGERGGEEVELNLPQIVIGRSTACKICISATAVSSRHAEIEAKEGKFIVRDLHSTNGTFLNGQKIDSSPLQHGDRAQIGLQEFVFRSSTQARPEILQEESFVLLPVLPKGYGEPVKLKKSCSMGSATGNDLVIPGAAAKHATISQEGHHYLLSDGGTQYGTFVNGQKIGETRLEHGDEIVIGKRKYIFKNTLRPLQREASFQVPYWFSIAAVAVFVFLICALALLTPKRSEPGPETTDKKEDTKTQKTEKEWISECENKVQQQTKEHQYEEAISTLSAYKAKLYLDTSKRQLDIRKKEVEKQHAFFKSLIARIKESKKEISLHIPTKGFCTIEKDKVNEQSVGVKPQDSPSVQISWQDIPSKVFLDMVEHSGLWEEKPHEAARLAMAIGHTSNLEKYLVLSLEKGIASKTEVDELFAKALNKKLPPGGFAIYRGRLIPLEEKNALDKAEQEKLAKLQAEQEKQREKEAKEKAEAAEKLAKERAAEREKTEFQFRYTVLDEFVRTYSYRQAIEKFKAFEEELISSKLKEKVLARIKQIKPMAALFDRLVKAINEKKLINDQILFDKDLAGKVVWASTDEFKVEIPQGSLKHKWYYLPPKQMYEFFLRMKLKPSDLYYVGIFCFENDLWMEGNQAFVRVLSQSPDAQKKVDRYLADKLGIPVPQGGFVPYQGMLVTQDEREKRQKGLTKYRGQWVTSEEKAKLEAGYIRYQGKWVTRDEKTLLAKGHRQYKGEWYTPQELAKIRSNWEDAWTCTTPYYDIRSNTSEEFTNELGRFMEAAFKEYEKLFERPTKKRMTLYAFRTYEDYRNYCLQTNNQGQVRAGGFASSKTNIGCGYTRDDNKTLLNTMIHEGAHLFHYNACPNSRPPSWFAEAIATQFEGYEWDGQKLKVHYISPSRLPWLQRSLRQAKYIPLTDMVKGSSLEYINRDPEEASTFYAQCWGLYYYLWNHAKQRHKTLFSKFVKKMHVGIYAGREEEAFLNEFKDEMDTMERDWRQYIISMN